MTFAQKKPKREHDRAYLEWIRQLPCIASACEGFLVPPGSVDAAHVSFLGQKGFGSKVSDHYAVPLAREAHDSQHSGNERLWWARLGVDPRSLTQALAEAYPDLAAGTAVILDFAARSHRTHRLRPAGELIDAPDAAPRRVTITAHLSDSRDENGNQGVILPTLGKRGCAATLVHVDPSAIGDALPVEGGR